MTEELTCFIACKLLTELVLHEKELYVLWVSTHKQQGLFSYNLLEEEARIVKAVIANTALSLLSSFRTGEVKRNGDKNRKRAILQAW